MSRKRFALPLLAATVLVATGCGPTPVHTIDRNSVCATVDTSTDTPVCTEAFAEGDPVVLPDDIDDKNLVGVVARNTVDDADAPMVFATRDGDYVLTGKALATVTPKDASPEAPGFDEVYANMVFIGALRDDTITDVTPLTKIDTRVILSEAFAGRVLEGTISTLDGDAYDLTSSVPVQIALADDITPSTMGFPVSLSGTITNATTDVQLRDGTPAPALSALGAQNPLQGMATEHVEIVRFPSMHAPFDDELVLAWNDSSSGMGYELYPQVATLLGLRPAPAEWTIFQHGNPTSGPALELTLVDAQ